MKAKINTTSNYRGLNGQWLELKEIVGTRVSCIVESEEFGKQTVDFKLSEVTELDIATVEVPEITIKQFSKNHFVAKSTTPVEINISKGCWDNFLSGSENVTVS